MYLSSFLFSPFYVSCCLLRCVYLVSYLSLKQVIDRIVLATSHKQAEGIGRKREKGGGDASVVGEAGLTVHTSKKDIKKK